MFEAVRKLVREVNGVRRMCGPACAAQYSAQVLLQMPQILRSGNLQPADRGMAHRARRFRVGKSHIVLDGSMFSGAREMYARQVYFSLDGFALSPGDVVMDLGSNCGLFTTLAAKCGCRTIAVDVQQTLLNHIPELLCLNDCDPALVSIVWGVIGPDAGVVSIKPELLASAPPILSMDRLLAQFAVEYVDFLKIDIEGSEFALFSQDVEWLDRVTRIAMEVHTRFGDPDVLAKRFRYHGFRVRLLDNGRVAKQIRAESGYLFADRLNSACRN
jgi:FkbM family methyltransferase